MTKFIANLPKSLCLILTPAKLFLAMPLGVVNVLAAVPARIGADCRVQLITGLQS